MPEKYITQFTDSNGIDLGDQLVEKSYLADYFQSLPQSLWSSQLPEQGLWTTGSGAGGLMGNGTTLAIEGTPAKLTNARWKSVSASCMHVLAVDLLTQSLWGWGCNLNGQLGDNTTISKSSPVQVGVTGTDWADISAGSQHAVGLKHYFSCKTLYTWGLNTNGQLGDSTTLSRSSPVQVGLDGDWKTVVAGDASMYAIKCDGTMWAWGSGQGGRLGNNNAPNSQSSPVQIGAGRAWKQVSTSCSTVHAVAGDGSLWGWGPNVAGRIGDGSSLQRNAPVRIGNENDWRQVSSGWSENAAAIKCDGTLWTWGLNSSGQLGDNTTISKSSPVQTSLGGSDWKKVHVGAAFMTAIKKDGTIWSWGSGANGRSGTGGTLNVSNPVQRTCGGDSWQFVTGVVSSYTQAALDESKM